MSIQRVRTIFTGVAGSPWYSNLYFTGETQTLADAATTATRAFWDSVKGYISTGISIQVQPDVPIINETTGVTFDVLTSATAPLAGTNAADALPRMTQGLIRTNTSGVVAGRRVKGRVFLPGFGEGTSSATGQPNPTDIALIQTAFTTNLVTPSSPQLVVWSRPNEAASRPGSSHIVNSATMWSQWAVLRSRRD